MSHATPSAALQRREAAAGGVTPDTRHGSAAPVLLVGPLPPPYHGVATAMRDLVALQERFGTAVVVLDTSDRRGLENMGRLDFGNVFFALRHAVEFSWKLIRHRPSAVSLFISQGPLAFLRDLTFIAPARLLRRPLVVHLQGGHFRRFYDGSPGWMKALIRWSLRGADSVIILGDAFRYIFDGLVQPERITVLPNAVDLTDFERLRAVESAARGGRQLLFLATISEEKGALDVLRALPKLREMVPDARLVMAGEIAGKPVEESIRRIIRENHLEDMVEFPGVVIGVEKIRLMLGSDVFVFPTKYPFEGHPYVLLEAMAAGLPLVTTNQGCITETVAPEQNGLIVPQGDHSAIAEAIARLLQDPAERIRMGAANVERVGERHDLTAWQSTVAGLFSAAAKRNGAA